MTEEQTEILSKVPEVTFVFWIIKILATTLGETGGDAMTMSFLGETTGEATGYGYLIGTTVFGAIFLAAVAVQIGVKRFHPFLYWLTIIATTTVGTTLADYVTRSIGIGYAGGSALLLVLLLASLFVWYRTLGSVSVIGTIRRQASRSRGFWRAGSGRPPRRCCSTTTTTTPSSS